MYLHAQGVDAERVGDHVQQLSPVPDTVGSPQPQRVIQVPVDALGVVTSSVEDLEVGITWRDLAHVLGTVELAFRLSDATGVLDVLVVSRPRWTHPMRGRPIGFSRDRI